MSKNTITYGIGGVYSITNKINGKRNIGSTIRSLESRWKRHKNSLNKGNHFSKHLQSAWVKYGAENFVFEIIIENIWKTEKELRAVETLFINLYQSYDRKFGYNTCNIAGSPPSRKGKSLTEEHKKNISESQKGEKGYWFGKKFSETTLKKIGLIHKGKPKTEEHKRKIGESQKGKIISKISRENMSKAKKGKKLSEQTKANMGKAQIGKHRGEKGANAKLKWVEVREIREKYFTGNYTYKQLSIKYNVKVSTISDIIKKRTWLE